MVFTTNFSNGKMVVARYNDATELVSSKSAHEREILKKGFVNWNGPILETSVDLIAKQERLSRLRDIEFDAEENFMYGSGDSQKRGEQWEAAQNARIKAENDYNFHLNAARCITNAVNAIL